jgi:hypothetical protein
MPWKPAALSDLERVNHALQMALLKARAQLSSKRASAERLEFLLCERMERIDELNGKLEQALEQNRKLEAEAEHLAQVVARPPTIAYAP